MGSVDSIADKDVTEPFMCIGMDDVENTMIDDGLQGEYEFSKMGTTNH